MNVEDVLRTGLASRADGLGHEPDPWGRFAAAERVHRRRRRRRAALAVTSVVAVAGLVQTNVLPLPGWAPTVPVTALAGSAALRDAPTRGSLAGDATWQDGLRALVQDVEDPEGVYRVGNRKDVRVLFAGDVPGKRLALLVVPLRLGVLTVEDTQWYEGPVGAAPAQMQKGANSGTPEDVASRVDVGDTGGLVMVIGPPGAQVEVSTAVRFGADGRLVRDWQQVGADGVGWLELPASRRLPQVAARVFRDGRPVFDGTVPVSGAYEAPVASGPQLSDVEVDDRRGGPPPAPLLRQAVAHAFLTTALDPRTTRVRVPWAGEVRGQAALVLTLQPRAGGVLVFTQRLVSRSSDETGTAQDLRLLLPAEGAEARPLAWRLRADTGEAETSQVVVVAPAGASRADLVSGGRSTPVQLDASGAGLAELEPSAEGVVRAYRRDGTLLGELQVPPFETDSSGVPGSTRGTRVVD